MATDELFSIPKDSPTADLFDPVKAPAPKAPTLNNKNREQLLESQADKQISDYVSSVISNERFIGGSLDFKKQWRDAYLKDVWEPYAANISDPALRERFTAALKSGLNSVVAKHQKMVDDSSGLSNIGQAVVGGISALADTGENIELARTSGIVGDANQRLQRLEAERRVWEAETSVSDADKAAEIARINEDIAAVSADRRTALDTMRQATAIAQDNATRAETLRAERLQSNFAEADRQQRRAELAAMGHSSPFIQSLKEGSIGEIMGDLVVGTAEQVPNMAAISGVSALVSLATGGAGAAALPALIASSGILGTSQGSSEVFNEVMGMSEEQLSNVPQYTALRQQGFDHVDARNTVASGAVLQGALTSGAASAVLGAFGPEALLLRGATPITTAIRGAMGSVPGTRLAGRALSAASGALGEGAEEGAQQAGVNLALQQSLQPDRSVTEGVLDAAAQGALVGVGPSAAGVARGTLGDVAQGAQDIINRRRGGAGPDGLTAAPEGYAPTAQATAPAAQATALNEAAQGIPAVQVYRDIAGALDGLQGAEVDEQTMQAIAALVQGNAEVDQAIVQQLLTKYYDTTTPTSNRDYVADFHRALGVPTGEAAASPSGVFPTGTPLTPDQMSEVNQFVAGTLNARTQQGIRQAIGNVNRMQEQGNFTPEQADYAKALIRRGQDGQLRSTINQPAEGTSGSGDPVNSGLAADTGAGVQQTTTGNIGDTSGNGQPADSGGTGGVAQQGTAAASQTQAYDAGAGDAGRVDALSGPDNRQLPDTAPAAGEGAGSDGGTGAQRADGDRGTAGTGAEQAWSNGLTEAEAMIADSFFNIRVKNPTIKNLNRVVDEANRAVRNGNLNEAQAAAIENRATAIMADVLDAALADEARADPAARTTPRIPPLTPTEFEKVSGFMTPLMSQPAPRLVAALERAMKMSRQGQLNNTELAHILDRIQMLLEMRHETPRGAGNVRARLLQARAVGDLDVTGTEMADALLRMAPEIANTLGVSITKPTTGTQGGMYDTAQKMLRLFKNVSAGTDIIHEVFHHVEQFLPSDMRAMIYRNYATAVSNFSETATDAEYSVLANLMAATLDGDAVQRAKYFEQASAIAEKAGMTDAQQDALYALTGPSEFFATNAASLFAARHEASTQGILARARQWIREFIQRLASFFDSPNTSGIIRAVDAVLDGKINDSGAGPLLSQSSIGRGHIQNTINQLRGNRTKLRNAAGVAVDPAVRKSQTDNDQVPAGIVDGSTTDLDHAYNTQSGTVITPAGYDLNVLSLWVDTAVERSPSLRASGYKVLQQAIIEGQYDTVDQIMAIMETRRSGEFALTSPRKDYGLGADTMSTIYTEVMEDAQHRQLMRHYENFKSGFEVRNYNDMDYAKRSYSSALLDAMAAIGREASGLAPSDRWYEALPEANKRSLARVYNTLKDSTVLVARNMIGTQSLPETNNTVSALPDSRLLGLDARVAVGWIKQNKLNNGKAYMVVDPDTGTAHIMSAAHQPLSSHPAAQTMTDTRSGRSLTPIQLTLNVEDGTVDTVVYAGMLRPELEADAALVPQGILPADFGNQIFIADMSTASQVFTSTIERSMLSAAQAPVNAIYDTTNRAFEDSTMARADTEVDSQGVLDAASAPNTQDSAMLSTVGTDQDVFTDLMTSASDIVNGDTRPTTTEVGVDETAELTVDGQLTQAPPQTPPVPTDAQRQAMSAAVMQRVNGKIESEASASGPRPAATQIPAGDMSNMLSGILNNYATLRAASAAGEQSLAASRFSPMQNGQGERASKMRTFGANMRRMFMDASTPLLEWIIKFDNVTNGMPMDHSLWKAKVLSDSTIAATAENLSNHMRPFEEYATQLAKRKGRSNTAVAEHLASFATQYHIVSEGSAAFRRSLVQNINDAQASGDPALIQQTQDRLTAYDAYQAGGQLVVPVCGGVRDIDAMRNLDYIQNGLGYTLDELMQGRQYLLDFGTEITSARLRAGTLTQEEVSTWNAFEGYVPLLVDKKRANVETEEAGFIYNPARDYTRTGSVNPAMNAYDSLIAYMNRAAAEIGGAEFRRELNATYERLGVKRAKEAGLLRTSVSALETLDYRTRREFDDGGSFLFRTQVRDSEGNPVPVTYRLKFEDPAVMTALQETTKAAWLKGLTKATSRFGQLYTRFRMAFAPVNFVRDTIERSLHYVARDMRDENGNRIAGTDISRRMVALTLNPRMLVDLSNAVIRGRDLDSYIGRWYTEFRNSGADFSFNRYQSKESVAGRNELKKLQGPGKVTASAMNAINSWNEVWNSAPALASYIAMREAGMTVGDAAFWTRDVMNMGAEGSTSKYLAGFFPFIRPIMQSSGNMLRTLGIGMTGGDARTAIRGWSAFGGLLTLYATLMPLVAASAGDDDNGNSVLDLLTVGEIGRGIPIFGSDGSRWDLPVGFGISQVAWVSSLVFDRVRRGVMTPGDGLAEITLATMKNLAPEMYPQYSFTKEPLKFIAQMFTPTIMRPIMDGGLNIDNFGRQIVYGSRAIGVSKAESGRHRTPDVWTSLAMGAKETIGLDMFPEQYRAVLSGYAAGPLQAIMGWAEQDSKYKSGQYPSTREALGPWLSALGSSAVYKAPMNVTARAYYLKKNDIEDRLNAMGVKITSAENAGSPQKADRYAATKMREAGISEPDIQAYMAIRASERVINKHDKAFRDNLKLYKQWNYTTEDFANVYAPWAATRESHMKNAIQYFGE